MNANDAPSKVLETVIETWKVTGSAPIPHDDDLDVPEPNTLAMLYNDARRAAFAARNDDGCINRPVVRIEADIVVRVYYTKEVDRG